MSGWVGGWMGGWMGGWVGGERGLAHVICRQEAGDQEEMVFLSSSPEAENTHALA